MRATFIPKNASAHPAGKDRLVRRLVERGVDISDATKWDAWISPGRQTPFYIHRDGLRNKKSNRFSMRAAIQKTLAADKCDDDCESDDDDESDWLGSSDSSGSSGDDDQVTLDDEEEDEDEDVVVVAPNRKRSWSPPSPAPSVGEEQQQKKKMKMQQQQQQQQQPLKFVQRGAFAAGALPTPHFVYPNGIARFDRGTPAARALLGDARFDFGDFLNETYHAPGKEHIAKRHMDKFDVYLVDLKREKTSADIPDEHWHMRGVMHDHGFVKLERFPAVVVDVTGRIVNVSLDAETHQCVKAATDRGFLKRVCGDTMRHFNPNAQSRPNLRMAGLRNQKCGKTMRKFRHYRPNSAEKLFRDSAYIDDMHTHARQMQAVEAEFVPVLEEYRRNHRALFGIDRSFMLTRKYDPAIATLSIGFSHNYCASLHSDGSKNVEEIETVREMQDEGNAAETIAWSCPPGEKLDESSGFALGCGIIIPFHKAGGCTPSPFSIGQGKYWHGTLRSTRNPADDPIVGTVILNKPVGPKTLKNQVRIFREKLAAALANDANPFAME